VERTRCMYGMFSAATGVVVAVAIDSATRTDRSSARTVLSMSVLVGTMDLDSVRDPTAVAAAATTRGIGILRAVGRVVALTTSSIPVIIDPPNTAMTPSSSSSSF
jgi:hypothetical protein